MQSLICLTWCCLFFVTFSKRGRGSSKCTSKIILSYLQILCYLLILSRQAWRPLIQLFFGFASDIDQTNIYRDIRDGNWLSNLVCSLILSSIPFSKRGRGRVKCTTRTISVFAPLGSFIDYIVYIESQMVHKYWEKPSLPTRISR